MRRALLGILDLHPDGGPNAPNTWERSPWGDTGWWTLVSPQGDVYYVYKESEDGGKGLFAIEGEDVALDRLEPRTDELRPARTLWRQQKAILRGWRTWRIDGQEVDENGNPVTLTGARRVLIPRGARLPAFDTLPWNLDADGNEVADIRDAVIRVTTLVRPAMAITRAGHSTARDFEDEPDPES